MKLELLVDSVPIIERDAVEELLTECSRILVSLHRDYRIHLVPLGGNVYLVKNSRGVTVARIYEEEFVLDGALQIAELID